MLRKLANQVSKLNLVNNSRRSFFSPYRDFDYFGNSLMRDIEREFRRDFGPQGFFGRNLPLYAEPDHQKPALSTYEKKTITTKDDGRVVVKTVRKVPGKPWQTQVEEYMDENKVQQGKRLETLESQSEQISEHGQQETLEQAGSQAEQKRASKEQTEQFITRHRGTDIFDEFDRDFRQLSNTFSRDFDDFFESRSGFDDFWGSTPSWRRSWYNVDPMSFDPENATYRLKTVINDNGKVTVKIASKDPGGEWHTDVKQYDQGRAVERGKKSEAIAEGSKTEQLSEKKEAENVSKEQAETQQTGNKEHVAA